MSKLDGFKAGDRFRAVLEGVVVSTPDKEGDLLVQWDGFDKGDHEYLFLSMSEAPTFAITRIDPPLKVGDMVRFASGTIKWELVAIRGDKGVLVSENDNPAIIPFSDLRRA